MAFRKRLVIANWKLGPFWIEDARTLARDTVRAAEKLVRTSVIICPPFPYLSELTRAKVPRNVFFGAQDASFERRGAHTGEVSAELLRNLGCDFVIVGHSERRARGETDAVAARKIRSVIESGATAVLCVGEQRRDPSGHYLTHLESQITASLDGVALKRGDDLVIAYEPVWAIGKTEGDAIEPRNLHTMSLFIKKVLTLKYGRADAESVRVIYGGSVEEHNASLLVSEGHVSGLLVGHLSTDARAFSKLLRNVDSV